MKTKEELNAIIDKYAALNRKLAELSDDEFEQVTGGLSRVKRGGDRGTVIVERRKREELNKPGLRRKIKGEDIEPVSFE